MSYLSLVVELNHPLPGPGRPAGDDWVAASVATYWPLLRTISDLVDRHIESALTLAISPSWTALAADPVAWTLTRTELDRRGSAPGPGRALRDFAVGRWGGDALGLLRQASDARTIELIPTTASHTWLPGVVQEPVLARAQVRLAADDHTRRFGARPEGIWLPFLAYLPGLETTLAEANLRYFGVAADALLKGTVLPPGREFEPLITLAGVAAFGVDPTPTLLLTDPSRRYARDPRYADRDEAPAATSDHAAHFLSQWRARLAEAPEAVSGVGLSLAAASAHDLGGDWTSGASWFGEVFRLIAGTEGARTITPARYLERHPEGTLGRPGPGAGGMLAVRPGGSSLLDRCRIASETLDASLTRRGRLGPLGRRALAQMTRALLQAQRLDWAAVPGQELSAEAGLGRAHESLVQFHELAGMVASGRLDPARIASLEAGPAYLPDLDLDVIG